MKTRTVLIAAALFYPCIMGAYAESTSSFERNANDAAGARWTFKNVPPPSRSDAGTKAKFTIVDGQRDGNGGDLERLHDGRVATTADQPSQNFFFNAGTDGGRLVADLDQAIDIKQVRTYSWHPGSRGPQVYKLYAADGGAADFNAQPKRGTDPTTCGWKFVASIDTRAKDAEPGGQYGVVISEPAGSIGKYRYLLFDVSRTEDTDQFGNTFYSEVDIIDRNAPAVAESETATPPPAKVVEAEGGKYQFTFDTALAPDLTEWVEKELAPVVQDWYPKIVQMLPSEGFEAPARVTLGFREDMRGTPAAAGGNRINCNIEWFRRNLKGEARGAVVHELVHVVQQYGRARRTNPNASRTPGWIVEGIADYIRWFLYEPQTKGAEISARNISRARYDASYRITGNFLNRVTQTYDKEIVRKLNAAAREGKYSEDLWKEYTGKTVQELGDEWKKHIEQNLAQ